MIEPHVEQARVASHIHRAESMAAARDLTDLAPLQQLVRQLLLEELARYRAAGQFPRNPGLGRQTPIFVDDHGTRCAMAHLLELGGEGALVEKIRTERNTAYVKELADEPRLVAWLAAAGLSVEEAAAIQPSYCETGAACICGGTFTGPVHAKGVMEVTYDGSRFARVSAVFGSPGKAVGESVEFSFAQSAGGQALVAATLGPDGGVSEHRVANGTYVNGRYSCSSQGAELGRVPPIAAADYAAAVMSADCVKAVTAQNPAYAGKACRPDGPAGCSSLAGDPTSLGILLSILGVLLARRGR